MICNVCGEDTRCYNLIEGDFSRGPLMRPVGMLFSICPNCLTKLITPIKTNKTVLDDSTIPISMSGIRNRIQAAKPIDKKIK